MFLPAFDRWARGPQAQRERNERATILVVDDDASVRGFIEAVLRKQGYRVLVASDGKDALAAGGWIPESVRRARRR